MTTPDRQFSRASTDAAPIPPALAAGVSGSSPRALIDLAAVLRAATDCAIIATDPDGVVTLLSDEAERMLGYRADEACGLLTLTAFHDPAELAARAAQIGVASGFEALSGAARAGGAESREWSFVRKDGGRLPVVVTVTAMRADSGALIGFVAIARDVSGQRLVETEQARLLHQAEEAERRFRSLVESAPDAIVIVDSAGCLTLVNRRVEELFGFQREELIGQPVEVLIPERLRETHVVHRAGYLRNPRTRPMGEGLLLAARRRDGTEFPVEISLSPTTFNGDLQVTAILRDVTSRRELERQKDEFLANVSHDLRTPLAGIKASIGVVLANEPPGTPEPLHRLLVNIDSASDRMAKLIGDLLELARLQAGRIQLRPDRCDLRALALRVVAAIEPLARERGQRVTVDVPAQPVPIVADAERLERALLNLLGNAYTYGRSGGTVCLTLARREGEALFAVQDDGPGIPRADQRHIFERFYRGESDATRPGQGSGLGLTIARAMVELHGGRIWVESVPGSGATFWISLPIGRMDREEDG